MRRHQDTICLIVLMGVLLALSASEGAAETCCHRELAMRPIAMPEGQEQQESLSTFFQGMVIGPLEMPTLDDKCPDFDFVSYAAMQDAYRLAREVFAATRRRDGLPPMPPTVAAPEQDLDYVFVGEITADEVTGKTPRECDPEYPEDCRGGFLEGTFTFRVKLVDHHRGQTLKEGSVSWTGHLWLDVGNRIEELSKSLFLPLDEIVREYERIPETAAVALPTEAVGAGETVTISLSDLFDHRGQQTQPWQRLLIKVEKGTILNGEQDQQAKEGYHVFRAGSDGIVRVQYRAPEECVPQQETLTVYNTCNKGENKADFRAKSYPQTLLATQDFDIVCDQWELEIEYHEQVSYTTREQHGDATLEEHISGTLDYRITATLRPASWQPADALRPYEDKEKEAKERLVEPRPTGVPGIPDDQRWQIERIEAEEARMRARANEVVGPGGRHDFIALGVELQLKDDFVHTRTWTIGTVEDDYRGEWHADQQGPIPLNIRLTTHANKNSYNITLTDHDPMDTGNPETHHPFTIPWRYVFRHTLTGQSPLDCSGTAEVEGNYPNLLFVDVPDDKLAYDGSQRVLRGEHSWTEGASELDVSGMETPGCSEKRALRNFNRVFPADSVTKTLKWTLRRLGGPGGP